jgi:hypothetical protein
MFGSWFRAHHSGHCDGCGRASGRDEDIRSDGQRGWLARCCGDGVLARAAVPAPDIQVTLLEQLAAGQLDTGGGTG